MALRAGAHQKWLSDLPEELALHAALRRSKAGGVAYAPMAMCVARWNCEGGRMGSATEDWW